MKYRFLDIEIDKEAFTFRRQGQLIAVEPRVLDFLVYLIGQRRRMVPKDELVKRVWGGAKVGASAITRCVSLARGLLGLPDAIRTIHRRGYQWMEPISGNVRAGRSGESPISQYWPRSSRARKSGGTVA